MFICVYVFLYRFQGHVQKMVARSHHQNVSLWVHFWVFCAGPVISRSVHTRTTGSYLCVVIYFKLCTSMASDVPGNTSRCAQPNIGSNLRLVCPDVQYELCLLNDWISTVRGNGRNQDLLYLA